MTTFTLSAQAAKDLIGSLSTLVEEALFTATPDSIKFRGMDPSHVALIDVELTPATYEGDGEKRFGVRIDELAKMVKRAGKDDIRFDIGDGDLGIEFGRRKYSLRLIDAPGNDTPLPKIDFDVKYTTTPKDMADALADISVVSNFVNIRSDKGIINFTGKGDTGEAATVPAVTEVVKHSDSTGCYSLEYLAPFVKSVSGDITAEFAENKPLRISVGGITFYLAPRVEQ